MNNQTTKVSINGLAMPLVEALCQKSNELRIKIEKCESGARIINAGIGICGGIEAGRLIAEICLGGLGTVKFTHSNFFPQWPLTVNVHTSNPVISCLASQYAGWSLEHREGGKSFHALGSGPARSLAQCEPLFKELNYKDKSENTVIVLEVDSKPPASLVEKIAQKCNISPANLSIILTPTSSLAGSVQVVSRVLEVALHKVHELGFALENVIDGVASAPLCPPAPDFIGAMGRTNDAILFGGQVQLFVSGEITDAKQLANQLPSSNSPDYGKPFAEIFKRYEYDFFKIDPMLFSPAQVTISHLSSGRSFHSGNLAPDLLQESFNSE